MRVQVIKLDENARVPTKGSLYSAGYDIYSNENMTVPARGWKLIKTGIRLGWDDASYYPQISPRSGLALKHGISPRAGVIDIDYRQEVGVILMNESERDFDVSIGDRIAQFIFKKIDPDVDFEEVTEFSPLYSNRNGGFGSTGV